MSRVAPGRYVIFNRVLDSQGKRLAMTFNGEGKSITVTQMNEGDVKQHWEVGDGNLQPIRPVSQGRLEAGFGPDKNIVTIPPHNLVWNIRSDEGWAIQDGERKIYWSVEGAVPDAIVRPIASVTGPQQRWIFQAVN